MIADAAALVYHHDVNDAEPAPPSAPEQAPDLLLRIVAGLLDFATLSLLAAGLAFGPALVTGAALPMIGAVIAILVYNVLPLTQLRGTLWMKILGLEIRPVDVERTDASLILFRELIGRGLLGAAFIGTSFVTFVGYLMGSMSSTAPQGFQLLLWGSACLLLVVGINSHLMVLPRPGQRGLHDFLGKTKVVRRVKDDVVVEDEFMLASKRRAIKMMVISQLVAVSLAAILPYLFVQANRPKMSLQDKVALTKAEKLFEEQPWNESETRKYLGLLRRTGQTDTYDEVQAKHRDVLAERAKNPELHDLKTQGHKKRLAADPCNKRLVLKLADRLNQISAYTSALKEVAAFEESCGPWNRLMWVSEYANRQLERYADAAAACTRLIEAEPNDSDFWWWRARNYGKLGDLERASSDYRHSMAVSPNKYAASYFATLITDTDPCEGAWALRHYKSARPDAGDWVDKRVSDLQLKGDCKSVDAPIRVAAKRDAVNLEVDASLNQTAGKFLVYSAAYVTVTRAFAEKAGLTVGEMEVPVFVAGDFVPAFVTKADVKVGRSTASQVPVAVVDQLPGESDGLLGLSLTWRYNGERTDKALTLTPR